MGFRGSVYLLYRDRVHTRISINILRDDYDKPIKRLLRFVAQLISKDKDHCSD